MHKSSKLTNRPPAASMNIINWHSRWVLIVLLSPTDCIELYGSMNEAPIEFALLVSSRIK